MNMSMNMTFRRARADELDAVCALYAAAPANPFSVWTELYPTRQDALRDLETDNLYVLVSAQTESAQPKAADGTVIGALSIVPENETDDLPYWRVTDETVREIARIVVSSAHAGHGYATYMVEAICRQLAERGCHAVHLSVAVENIPAYKSYCRAGFTPVGKADMFDGHYILMEKKL